MVKADTKINKKTESFVVDLVGTLFGGIAALDTDTLRANIQYASTNGWELSDRSIRLELANYILKNFSVIYLGLVANNDFRDSFKDAVSVEMDLMDKDPEFVKEIRAELADGPVKPSKGNFVLDFGKYNEHVAEKISGLLEDSLKKILPYEDDFNALQEGMTMDDAIKIGFVISNFAYLIKAFDKNPAFAHYVKSVVSSVKTELQIS